MYACGALDRCNVYSCLLAYGVIFLMQVFWLDMMTLVELEGAHLRSHTIHTHQCTSSRAN